MPHVPAPPPRRARIFPRTFSPAHPPQAHERDVDLDLLLLLLRRRLRAQAAARAANPAPADAPADAPSSATEDAGPSEGAPAAAKGPADLRVVVMSATIDASAFADYLRPPPTFSQLAAASTSADPRVAAESSGGSAHTSVPTLRVGSRGHEVRCYELEATQAALKDSAPPSITVEAGVGAGGAAKLHPSVFPLVEHIINLHVRGKLLSALPNVPGGVPHRGGVLVFLPGFAEIQARHSISIRRLRGLVQIHRVELSKPSDHVYTGDSCMAKLRFIR